MKILLFGATGSAGGSVLRVCLADPAVEEVRAIARRPLPLDQEKLRVLVHGGLRGLHGRRSRVRGGGRSPVLPGDLRDPSFRRGGVSADHVRFCGCRRADLAGPEPGAAFHFISGQGTSLSSRFMWARVKAETERELMDLVEAFCWRPAAIDGALSDNAPRACKVLRPLSC